MSITRGEVLHVLELLAGAAAAVGADREDAVLRLHGGRAAGRALLRRARLAQALALAVLDQRRDRPAGSRRPPGSRPRWSPSRTSLRARSSSLWRVAWLTVTAAHLHRLELGERDHVPDPPDVPDDVPERRRRGHRRELPGDRPARLAADDPQLAPERALVHLDDDAVDLVVEPLAPLLPPAAALDHALDAAVRLDLALDRESPRREASRARRSASRARCPSRAPMP